MWKKRIITHGVAFVIVSLVSYVLIAPAIVGKLFPQYGLMKKYVDVQLCTDLPDGATSAFFLPARCNAINKEKSVACTYDSEKYNPPAQATSDETTLCPLFVTQDDARGVKNVAMAQFPIQEIVVHNITAVIVILLWIGLYITFLILKNKLKKRR